MRSLRLAGIVTLTAVLGACAAKAQVPVEVEVPTLDPPPPPPRVVATYPAEAAPIITVPPTEGPPLPAPRPPARPETRPEPVRIEPPVRPPTPPSLTMTPAPGTATQTEAAIRTLLAKAARDLSRVSVATLSTDGRTQLEAARRFVQQADDELKAGNLVFAGKLADKAAIMAAGLVR